MRAPFTILMFCVLLVSAGEAGAGGGLWNVWPASRWEGSVLFRPLGGSSTSRGGSLAAAASAPAWAEALAGKLQRRVSLDLKSASLDEACRLLSDALDVTVVVSPRALERARPFDLRVRAMRAELALNWICRLAGADWVLKDEAVFVRPRSEAPGRKKSVSEIVNEILEKESYSPPDFPAPEVPFER